MSKKPDESQIESLLEGIQAEPSTAFYEQMKNAPWQKQKPKLLHFPYKKAVALIVFSIALLLLFQPARVIAELLAAYFQVQPSEGNITMAIPEPTATFVPSISPTPDIAILQTSLSFTIRQPAYLPEGYIIQTVASDSELQSAELYYTFTGGNPLGRSLALFQSPEGYDFDIGDNALVQIIDIAGLQGEYLQGNWETISSSETSGTLSIDYIWDNTVQMHYLAWERDGVSYRLLWQAAGIPYPEYYGDGAPDEAGYLSLEDLIRIAASIR